MAGWIQSPLGTEVDLGPGDIVLHGDPAPSQNMKYVSVPFNYTALACSFISERELTFTFAICYRPSVCRLVMIPLIMNDPARNNN